MNRLFITISILAACMSHAQAQLPDGAKELISKLSNWELDRQADLQKEIQGKRNEVAKLLQAMLEQQTKSGDLEGALAIKQEIERIQLPLTEKPQEAEQAPADKPDSKAPELDWFVGQTWGAGGATTFAFEPEGKGVKNYRGVPSPMKWEILESGVVRVFGAGAPEFFRFKSRRRGEIAKTETFENSKEIQPE